MPLGATELTLSEAVVVYRGLITGDTMRVRGKVAANDEGWELHPLIPMSILYPH